MQRLSTPTLCFGGGFAVGAVVATMLRRAFDRRASTATLRQVPIYRVALTGGPCGGKSSSLIHFAAALRQRGFDVYAVPEIPTILFNGGARYPGLDAGPRLVEFESALLALQLQAEDSFLRCAVVEGRPAVVVYDRGVMDMAAYLPRDDWLDLLRANGLSEEQLLRRYDLVLHMVTTAEGAEAFYTTDNNSARTETPEQARVLDKKVMTSWEAHPAQHVVRNGGSFQDKLENATAQVMAMVDGSLEKNP